MLSSRFEPYNTIEKMVKYLIRKRQIFHIDRDPGSGLYYVLYFYNYASLKQICVGDFTFSSYFGLGKLEIKPTHIEGYCQTTGRIKVLMPNTGEIIQLIKGDKMEDTHDKDN